jgi:hypothetical protein
MVAPPIGASSTRFSFKAIRFMVQCYPTHCVRQQRFCACEDTPSRRGNRPIHWHIPASTSSKTPSKIPAHSRVACEVLCKHNHVVLAGEITSRA